MTMGFGFCANCGTPRVAAEQRFCAGCGLATAPVASPAPPAPAPPAPEPIAAPVSVSSDLTSPIPPQPASEPIAAVEAPSAPPPWAAQPVAPPAWSTPPVAAPMAPPPWAAQPAAPGAPIAQAVPPVYPGTPASAPAATPRAPSAPIATVAGVKVTPKLLAIGAIALVLVIAVIYVSMGSKSAGISFTPSSFSCSSSIQVTSAITLPSSLGATIPIVLTIDGVVQRRTTVGAYMNHQTDGSWTREGQGNANDACQGVSGQLAPGTHVVRVVDVNGRVLAEGSFTLTP